METDATSRDRATIDIGIGAVKIALKQAGEKP